MERSIHRERWRLLHQVVRFLELPMTMLGLIWMVLLTIDLVRGLHGRLAMISEAIWIGFGVDFGLEWLIAPNERVYLKRHWPVALSLAVPALRIVRFVRVAHVMRTAGTIRVGHSLVVLNRALAALGATLRRRGFAYVSVLTLFVVFAGAAGIYNFESRVSRSARHSRLRNGIVVDRDVDDHARPDVVAGHGCRPRAVFFFLVFMRSRCSAT